MRRGVVGIALGFVSAAAVACPLCLGVRSPAQNLVDLPNAMLAVPLPDGKSYRVVEGLKGARPDTITEVVVSDAAAIRDGKALLLVRDEAWPMWTSLGSIDAGTAVVLATVAAKRPPDTDIGAWHARIELLAPHLESADRLLADIAYAECARAPYAALRDARDHFDPRAVRRWLDDPALVARQPLYWLLLGVSGDASDAERVERRLPGTTSLGSMLAADMELRGPASVSWIEARFLTDRSVPTRDIQAALLALSVQANSNGAITREHAIAAYRRFMAAHPDNAGLVAQDLAAWEYWDAIPIYNALMASGIRQQYASAAGILTYLHAAGAAGR